MPAVVLWWKPGCVTNARQVALLKAAGCQVQVRTLLTEAWTAEALTRFFGTRPVNEWFNPAAPAVKNGSVIPEALGPVAALDLLIADPILIRRPLLEVDQQRCSGFDTAWLQRQGIVLPAGPVPDGCSHDAPDGAPAAHCALPSSTPS